MTRTIVLAMAASALFAIGSAHASPGSVTTQGSGSPPPTGSINLSPNPIYLVPGAVGTQTIDWTWNQPGPYWQYGCLYVSKDHAAPGVVDCEHPGNPYHVTIPWIQGGHTYEWFLVGQNSPNDLGLSYPPPAFAMKQSIVSDPTPRTSGTMSASPMVVHIPAGQSMGSTLISYNIVNPGNFGGCIWIANRDSAGTHPLQLWSCGGASGDNLNWPYVPVGGSTTFYLNQDSSSLNGSLTTITVTGVQN